MDLTQSRDQAEAAIRFGRLGNALLRDQRLPEAIDAYRSALRQCPGMAEIHSNLGHALRAHGHPDAAEAALRTAICLDPANPRARYNLGATLADRGRWPEAAACYQAVIALQPDVPEAHNDLGFALAERDELPAAAAALRRAIALRPGYAQAHRNLGHVLARQQRLDEAAACYRQALDLRPDCAVAHNNLGTVLEEQGDGDQAIASYRTAVALDPGFAEAHANLGMALLTAGVMQEGWAAYEWRLRTPAGMQAAPAFDQPAWNGEDPAGRTVLIHAEQGLGDTLQFCRYVPLVAALGARVVLLVPHALLRLMRALPGVDRLIAPGDSLPPFDLHVPMLSLPHALGGRMPPSGPYLRGDPVLAARWRARLPPGPRIGLAWAGNPRTHAPARAAVDRRRSMAPERLAPLFEIEGLCFVSLQKDGPAAPPGSPLIDQMDRATDFADTAALVACLDLVVSVDTAVVHLAAAMGKPAWLLNRFDSCWRWGRGRPDSDWYPSLTQYRQPAPGDWDSVLAAVARDLREIAAR